MAGRGWGATVLTLRFPHVAGQFCSRVGSYSQEEEFLNAIIRTCTEVLCACGGMTREQLSSWIWRCFRFHAPRFCPAIGKNRSEMRYMYRFDWFTPTNMRSQRTCGDMRVALWTEINLRRDYYNCSWRQWGVLRPSTRRNLSKYVRVRAKIAELSGLHKGFSTLLHESAAGMQRLITELNQFLRRDSLWNYRYSAESGESWSHDCSDFELNSRNFLQNYTVCLLRQHFGDSSQDSHIPSAVVRASDESQTCAFESPKFQTFLSLAKASIWRYLKTFN